MKWFLGVLVLGLLWCNVGITSEAGGIREPGTDPKCSELFEKEKIFEKEFLPIINNKGILVTYVGCNKDYDNWGWWNSTTIPFGGMVTEKLGLDTAHAKAYRGCVGNQLEKYKLTGCHLFSIDDVIVWGKDDAFVKKIEKDAFFANFVARLQLGKGATFANYVTKLPYLFPNALFTKGEGDIIIEKDPTTFQNIVFVKKKTIKGWDRRGASGGYSAAREITFKVFVFKATFLKGRRDITIRVNAEFETENKAKEQAIKYAKIIGQLPNFLRTKNLKTLTIHKGNEKWGGGHNDILIYTDMYQWGEFTEEVAIHEAAHTTLDPQWHGSIKRSKWNKAMKADNKFVSPYAKKYPKKEDIAETINWWIAVRCKSDRISKLTYEKIILGIPNRLKYLDEQNYDTYPLVCK
ncbi:hypothetical protein OAT04_03175 [Candidatus Pelagibacter sp.]|nr:hypothetical protein [Candidatus Pelagibacter sp.]